MKRERTAIPRPEAIDPRQGVARDGLPASLYLLARQWLLANDPDAQQLLEWSRSGCVMPDTPEKMASEVIWVILCAGRSAQAARTIEKRVWQAIRDGRPVLEAFGYRAKAAAIERAWREREQDFAQLQAVAASGDMLAVVKWCRSLPYIGAITSSQLAKNFGFHLVKADRHVSRFAGIPDSQRISADARFERCQQFALELSAATGDTVPMIDSLLYLAGNKGVLRATFDPHRVHFEPPSLTRRSIYEAAPATASTSPV